MDPSEQTTERVELEEASYASSKLARIASAAVVKRSVGRRRVTVSCIVIKSILIMG